MKTCGTLAGSGFTCRASRFALVGEDPFHQRDLLRHRAAELHRLVVLAAHAERVDVLVLAVRFEPSGPVIADGCGIRLIVPLAAAFAVPFGAGDVVAQHRLNVAAAHDDGVVVGDDLVLRVAIEGRRLLMHRGPEIVGAQAQQQLEDLGVGLGPETQAFVGREVLRRPRPDAPHLVVDEDAAVLHRGRSDPHAFRGNVERVAMRGRHIGPPIPRRHADPARQFINAVRRPAAVAAGDDQAAARHPATGRPRSR